MNRGAFLFGMVAAVAAAPASDIDIPVEVRGGRFFAIPRVADGRHFTCWLDTDGAGFIFDSAVSAFALETRSEGGRRRAALPSFVPPFPPLTAGKDLPVFERSAEDRKDPILEGFDAQLGRTWFAARTWRFDWANARCTLLARTLEPSQANVPVTIAGGVPRLPVTVGDETFTMSFDSAASVALKPDAAVRATTFVRQGVVDRWHRRNPDWKFARNIGVPQGIDRIVVPDMRVGTQTLRNVECTTRPGDDVFEEEDVSGKVGANAFAGRVVVLDYRSSRFALY